MILTDVYSYKLPSYKYLGVSVVHNKFLSWVGHFTQRALKGTANFFSANVLPFFSHSDKRKYCQCSVPCFSRIIQSNPIHLLLEVFQIPFDSIVKMNSHLLVKENQSLFGCFDCVSVLKSFLQEVGCLYSSLSKIKFYTVQQKKSQTLIFLWTAFSSDYGTHSLWHRFDKLLHGHTYFRPELH